MLSTKTLHKARRAMRQAATCVTLADYLAIGEEIARRKATARAKKRRGLVTTHRPERMHA